MISEKKTVEAILSDTNLNNAALSNFLLKKGKAEVKDSGAMWRSVCAAILINKDKFSTASELQEFMDHFGDFLSAQTEHKDVPLATKGKNKGKPAWRSWTVTKPRWQYANYIFNAIEKKGGIDLVFPADKPLPSLKEVRDMGKKDPESALATVKRCVSMIENKTKDMTKEDLQESLNLVASLSVTLSTLMAGK